MTGPTLLGRKLPANDWENDDSPGKPVTCTDTAVGRMVAYATNGRVDLDGRAYRAALHPHDPDGITLAQAATACHALTGRELVIPTNWRWPEVIAHLRARKGLVVQGWYATLPIAHRHQAAAAFGHAMWISHESPTSGMRTWDPLNPNLAGHGAWIPTPAIRAFMESLRRPNGALYVAYVALEDL